MFGEGYLGISMESRVRSNRQRALIATRKYVYVTVCKFDYIYPVYLGVFVAAYGWGSFSYARKTDNFLFLLESEYKRVARGHH